MFGQPYPPECGEQILSLRRSGRCVASLARDYEPSAATIHDWIEKAEVDRDNHGDHILPNNGFRTGFTGLGCL